MSENDNQYCSAFLSAFPDLMFVLSTDGIFIDVHAGDREKLLLPPESFLNKSVHEVFGGVVADRTIDRIERLQATAEIQEYTYSLEIAEEERTFEARMAPYGRDDVLVVVRDITDKSRIASLAQEQEFYLSAIFQTTQDGIWVVDPQQRVVDVNESYCRMTGYSREEMLGMSIRDVDVDESPEETRARVERIIDCGRESFQARHRCKDGS
ncbi:MAG TPA: PAS domain-containing protein, partial [Opitutales bacterium]|nr:PAS domain-containing protein [Opitutales bacterium]